MAGLLDWSSVLPTFALTSTVDGQRHRAGFADGQICEAHGSIHWLQRLDGQGGVWPADDTQVHVDLDAFSAAPPFPRCPRTGALARPNILMFGDYDWEQSRADAAMRRYAAFVRSRGPRPVVIELGAGPTTPGTASGA